MGGGKGPGLGAAGPKENPVLRLRAPFGLAQSDTGVQFGPAQHSPAVELREIACL